MRSSSGSTWRRIKRDDGEVPIPETITTSQDTVIVCLSIHPGTGAIDLAAPFVVIPSNPSRAGIYQTEPEVIAQFLPGERQAWFRAEWSERDGWKIGKRVA